MVRSGTPAKNLIDHTRHDALIGMSNYKQRKTCVIYKDAPYFDPFTQQNPSSTRGSVFICNGQIISDLNQYLILIERSISQSFQKVSTPLMESSRNQGSDIKKFVGFLESTLDEVTVKALKNSPGNSRQKMSDHEYAQLLQGVWARKNSYRVLKKEIDEKFGETDYTDNAKRYTFIIDISIARDSSPGEYGNITVVSRKRTHEGDIGSTNVVVSGQPKSIVEADVSNSNKTITNIKNGIPALLSDTRVIQLKRKA